VRKLLFMLLLVAGCQPLEQRNGVHYFTAEGQEYTVVQDNPVYRLLIMPSDKEGYAIGQVPELATKYAGYRSYPITVRGVHGYLMSRQGTIITTTVAMDPGMVGAPILLEGRVVGIVCRYDVGGTLGLYIGDQYGDQEANQRRRAVRSTRDDCGANCYLELDVSKRPGYPGGIEGYSPPRQ